MIQLREDTARGDSGGAITWVTWCLTKDVQKEIKEYSTEHPEQRPFLLLTVGNLSHGYLDEVDECRQVVELSQARACVTFPRGGKHLVLATIVFAESIRNAKKSHMERKRKNDYYEERILNNYSLGNDEQENPFQDSSFSYGMLDVTVNPELFAKKPRDLEWLTTVLSGVPNNECEVRRYRMFAYTIQPILVAVLWGVLMAVAGIYALMLALYGMRGVQWEHLNLFKENSDLDKVTHRTSKSNSVFITNKNGNLRPWCGIMFSPLAIVVIWFLMWVLFVAISEKPLMWVHYATLAVWTYVTLGLASLWLAYTLLKIIYTVTHDGWSALTSSNVGENFLARQETRRLEKLQQLASIEYQRLPALDCDVVAQDGVPAVSNLSFRSRAYVGYHGFLSAVCRPIAK